MDTHQTQDVGENTRPIPRGKPPGLILAWISGMIVFVLSTGILIVVFTAVGRTPWPTGNPTPKGTGLLEWLCMDLLIAFLAFLAGRSAFRSTLKAETERLSRDINRYKMEQTTCSAARPQKRE